MVYVRLCRHDAEEDSARRLPLSLVRRPSPSMKIGGMMRNEKPKKWCKMVRFGARHSRSAVDAT